MNHLIIVVISLASLMMRIMISKKIEGNAVRNLIKGRIWYQWVYPKLKV
jgi:hypothetical protein